MYVLLLTFLIAAVVVGIGIYRFREWVRTHRVVLEIAILTLGGFASVVIAAYAARIDEQVANNSVKQAQYNRSLSLGQSIFRDPAFEALTSQAARIQIHIDRKIHENARRSEIEKMKIDSIFTISKEQGVETLHTNILRLLQHVDRIFACNGGNVAQTVKEDPCDRSTFLALSGQALSDVYNMFRPVLVYDQFFLNGDNISEDVEDLTKTIYEYRQLQKLNGEGPPFPIFRTAEDAKADGHDPDDPNDPFFLILFRDDGVKSYYEAKFNSEQT